MAAESPGSALLEPPNTIVIDPPGTAVIAPTPVPAEAEEYALRTQTRGPSTYSTGATQPATDAMTLVPVNLPTNSPRSGTRRVKTSGGAIRTG